MAAPVHASKEYVQYFFTDEVLATPRPTEWEIALHTASPGTDQIEFTPGSPGFIRYTLAPDFSIAAGSYLQIRIGNHASTALLPETSFSTTTGTTTIPGDPEAILNSTPAKS